MGNFKAEAASLPVLYGDTPTLFGKPFVRPEDLRGRADVAISGVPWEGTVTWGTWSGCELAPRTIRQASARYTGFLPEYGVDAFDHLRLADCGDVVIDMQDRKRSFAAIEQRIGQIVEAGVFPATYGGDHAISFPIIKAITERRQGKLGIVHFDAHYDNKDEYDGDRYARCCPFRRVAELPGVRSRSMVHLGIRGPRNMKEQQAYAESIGATTLSINAVRERGIDAVVEEAHRIASVGTDGVYVTVCSDVLDAAFNPGGPTDANGLTTYELYRGLHYLGQQENVIGFDLVEIYPPADPGGVSSHMAVWALLHLLVGMAERRASR
ncbi:MAG: agmatinase family protein [Thermaerobacter sp.]|nr:agmatinase family protein [Thermaerobacter sp.]